MASLTMTATFLGGAAAIAERPSAGHRRSLVVARAGAEVQEAAKEVEAKKEQSGRRAAMAAAAAAALLVVGQGIAVAIENPKRGTAEAKKVYAPVCVTMPTAKICHK